MSTTEINTAENGAAPQGSHGHGAPSMPLRKFPPIAEITVLSLAMMLAGGVYLAAHLPVPPPVGPAAGLVVAGGVLTLIAVFLLLRIRPFAWSVFLTVAKWAFLAYLVIAGILAFVFIYDHTRGATLAVLLATLVVFAVDVPMIVAFTVARFNEGSLPTSPE